MTLIALIVFAGGIMGEIYGQHWGEKDALYGIFLLLLELVLEGKK